jgi:NAD(P)-dependent dehydrogenase (short-subunit alcohol dehydrogenase family)
MENAMLQGKVAVVTGAGRGIGLAVATMMADHGAKVVVNDPGYSVAGEESEDRPADEVVGEITAAGGTAVANYDSVVDVDGAGRIVQQALDSFGRIDIVVNNAGILRDRIFHKMTPEDWRAVIDVHLHGSFNVSHHAARHFREQQSGSFVHMTSTSGLVGNVGQANYAAAKMGIVGLSRSIALDMARFNVRSNCISPFAWSRMIGSIPDTPDQRERLEKLQKMTPEKIAPLAVYLASDAAGEVNGQIFAVRGAEMFLMSQSRPVRGLHRAGGWTPQAIAEHAIPAMKSSFVALERSPDVFNWDPPE